MGEKSDGETLGYRFDKKFWKNNPAGHPAGLFVALKVFMYMFIYISLVCG